MKIILALEKSDVPFDIFYEMWSSIGRTGSFKRAHAEFFNGISHEIIDKYKLSYEDLQKEYEFINTWYFKCTDYPGKSLGDTVIAYSRWRFIRAFMNFIHSKGLF